ncbi:MAG: PIN domain-containing protein [Candidatus Daviesbacteria bacterium]|nr:PIN domain-containing protein [Candidatus Daviesbacteria bacterium]
MICLDANIILRFVLDNDPILSPKAKIIIEKIQLGKTRVYFCLLALSEVIFTLERSYHLPKKEIVKALSVLFSYSNIKVESQKLIEEAFVYYVDKNVSFVDAYYLTLMQKKNIKKIYSFDRDFDKFLQIKRLEK